MLDVDNTDRNKINAEDEFLICMESIEKLFEESEERMTKLYITFCRNMSRAGQITEENYGMLAAITEEVQKEMVARDGDDTTIRVLPFEFYLSKPFQRITKYPLMFDNIYKQTKKLANMGLEDNPDALMKHLNSVVTVTKRMLAKVNFRWNPYSGCVCQIFRLSNIFSLLICGDATMHTRP